MTGSIFDAIPSIVSRLPIPYLNTGTFLDLVNGSFVPSIHDGSYILTGGLSRTLSVIGPPGFHKSTVGIGYAVNSWARCPNAELLVHDTEDSQEEKRILGFVSNLKCPDVTKFRLTGKEQYMGEDLFNLIQEIANVKLKNEKDYIVETPILDTKTGKPIKMLIPTIIVIDSITKLEMRIIQELLAKHDLTDSELNTIYMKDGIAKKKLLSGLTYYASKANIFVVMTAHIKQIIDMTGPYDPKPKGQQFMRSNEKISGTGSDFGFLVSTGIENRSVKVLENKEGTESFYPEEGVGIKDLVHVQQIVFRSKGNVGGSKIGCISSQSRGFLPDLSNYHFLREENDYGLTGNNITKRSVFLENVGITRTTVTEKLKDRKLARAIEIAAHLRFIQKYWATLSMEQLTIPADKLAEMLITKSGYAIDDILHSRGWWTYDDKHYDLPYLSLIDICNIATGAYKPKLLSVKTVTKSEK